MGIFRFESNGVKKPSANAAKVLHFDGSPYNAVAKEYSLRNIELRDERREGKEDVFDVYGARFESVDENGKDVLSKPMKVGELFYHAPDYPGGPCRRLPVSTERFKERQKA